MSYHDSVFNQESTRKLVSSDLNYNFEKTQAANKAKHETQLLVLESENKIQKQLRLFLFLVIAFCVVILVFVQRAYRNKKQLAAFLGAEDNRKELLLQEVHHRINNNLQIISSLLSLQANSADDERLNVYLKQSQNRIQSLSALHELLYQNNSSLQVNMQEYIEKVLDFHKEVAGTLPAKVTIETEVKDVMFPTKIAVPLALIINELVTNSLKYAFTGKASGKIKIRLATGEKSTDWKLTVEDDGKGMGPVEERRKGSLGLRLVNIMVKQIGGKLVVNEGAGASFEVDFTVQKQKSI
jgi:two-component sensor histidine kinase